MNHSDYSQNPHLQPAPGPEFRPDRQEPEPVPVPIRRRQLLPRDWFTGGQLRHDSPLGTLRLALGHAEEAVLSELQFRLNAQDAIELDGKLWTARTHKEMARHAGMSVNTFKTKLDRLAARERQGAGHKKVLAIEDAVIEIRQSETADQTCWYTIRHDNVERLAIEKLQELNPGWKPTLDRSDLPPRSERSTPPARSDLPLGSERSTDLYIETNQETFVETTARKPDGGGGEILNVEPGEAQQTGLPAAQTPAPEPARNRKPEKRKIPIAPPVQSRTGLANDRNPIGDRSSAADFSAAGEILDRAERELGDRIGARRELLKFAPQALQEALSQTLHERDGSPADAIGMFVRKSREQQEAIAKKLELQASQEDAKRLAAQLYAEHDRLLIPLQERKVIQNPAFRRIAVYTLHDIVKRPEEAQAYLAWLQEQPTPAPVDWSLEAEAWDDEEQEQAAGSAGAALVWEILAQSRTRAFPAAAQAKVEPVATCRVPVG